MDYWDLIKAAHETVDIYNGEAPFLRDFSQLTTAQQHLLAAHWCFCEVSNGGLDQFFHNPTGVLAIEAVRGLRAIGLNDAASIVQEGVARFATPYPRDRAARMAAMERLPEGFRDLDERFGDTLADFDEAAKTYAESMQSGLEIEGGR